MKILFVFLQMVTHQPLLFGEIFPYTRYELDTCINNARLDPIMMGKEAEIAANCSRSLANYRPGYHRCSIQGIDETRCPYGEGGLIKSGFEDDVISSDSYEQAKMSAPAIEDFVDYEPTPVETAIKKNEEGALDLAQCPPKDGETTTNTSLKCYISNLQTNGLCSSVDDRIDAECALQYLDQSFKNSPNSRKKYRAQFEALSWVYANGDTQFLAEVNDENLDTLISSCEKQKKIAQTCCSNAQTCLSDTGEGGQTVFGKFFGAVSGLGGAAVQSGMLGAAESCSLMQNLARGGSTATIALSQMCRFKVSNCSDSCGDVYEFVKNIKSLGSEKLSNGETVCDNLKASARSAELSEYSAEYIQKCQKLDEIVSQTKMMNPAVCENFAEDNWSQQLAALSQFAVTEVSSRNCKNLASDGTQTASLGDQFKGDCSDPAHFYNSLCVQCRADASLPQCAGIKGLPTANNNSDDGGITIADYRNADTGGALGISAPIDALGEDPFVADPAATPLSGGAGLAQGAGGGGSGGLGGGRGDDGGLAPQQGPGGNGGDSGLDANILKGERGGGGYKSTAMGFNEPPGGSGYGSRRTANDVIREREKKKFNLKGYLPGKRKLASLNLDDPVQRRIAGIGSEYDDIFKMSNEAHEDMCANGYFWCDPDSPRQKKEIEESVKQSNMEKVFKENLDKSLVQVLKGLLKGKLPPAKNTKDYEILVLNCMNKISRDENIRNLNYQGLERGICEEKIEKTAQVQLSTSGRLPASKKRK